MTEIENPDVIRSGVGAFSQAPRWLSTNRPPYPKPGLFGWATDTGIMEVWTGSTWLALQQGPATNWALQPSYDNDAAAQAGGVQLGQMYRNGNFLMVCLI